MTHPTLRWSTSAWVRSLADATASLRFCSEIPNEFDRSQKNRLPTDSTYLVALCAPTASPGALSPSTTTFLPVVDRRSRQPIQIRVSIRDQNITSIATIKRPRDFLFSSQTSLNAPSVLAYSNLPTSVAGDLNDVLRRRSQLKRTNGWDSRMGMTGTGMMKKGRGERNDDKDTLCSLKVYYKKNHRETKEWNKIMTLVRGWE